MTQDFTDVSAAMMVAPTEDAADELATVKHAELVYANKTVHYYAAECITWDPERSSLILIKPLYPQRGGDRSYYSVATPVAVHIGDAALSEVPEVETEET